MTSLANQGDIIIINPPPPPPPKGKTGALDRTLPAAALTPTSQTIVISRIEAGDAAIEILSE